MTSWFSGSFSKWMSVCSASLYIVLIHLPILISTSCGRHTNSVGYLSASECMLNTFYAEYRIAACYEVIAYILRFSVVKYYVLTLSNWLWIEPVAEEARSGPYSLTHFADLRSRALNHQQCRQLQQHANCFACMTWLHAATWTRIYWIYRLILS